MYDFSLDLPQGVQGRHCFEGLGLQHKLSRNIYFQSSVLLSLVYLQQRCRSWHFLHPQNRLCLVLVPSAKSLGHTIRTR